MYKTFLLVFTYLGNVFVPGSAEGTVNLAWSRKDIFATVCSFVPFEFEVILAYYYFVCS